MKYFVKHTFSTNKISRFPEDFLISGNAAVCAVKRFQKKTVKLLKLFGLCNTLHSKGLLILHRNNFLFFPKVCTSYLLERLKREEYT